MARPRKKYSLWTALKFLFIREIQILQPRISRAKLLAESKKIDKVEKQYEKLKPIKEE